MLLGTPSSSETQNINMRKLNSCGDEPTWQAITSYRSVVTLVIYWLDRKGSTTQKSLFEITKSCSSADNLAKKFGDFFIRKSTDIRDTTDADNSSLGETVVMETDATFLTQLDRCTQAEVRDVIIMSQSKSSPWPFAKARPLISVFINGSLVESTFPLCFKKADVRPSLRRKIWIKR